MPDKIANTPENLTKVREAAGKLIGTCNKSVDEALQEAFGDETLDIIHVDIELLRELDDITMECQGCNWWCETSELNDDQLCGDCAKENDDD